MPPHRTVAEIEAELAELKANFEAAKTALKTTPLYDNQRAEWHYIVATYRGRQDNLTEDLRRARLREGRQD